MTTTQTPKTTTTNDTRTLTPRMLRDAAWFLQRVVPRGTEEAEALDRLIHTLNQAA